MKLVGLRGFSVVFDVSRNKWNLSKPGSSVMGFSSAAHHTYLLGKHEWSIMGDLGLGGVKNTTIQNSMGALSNPISFALRISKQFLFLKCHFRYPQNS